MKQSLVLTVLAFALALVACTSKTQQVSLYYYNPELDLDSTGNIQCSSAGLVPVQRAITGSESGMPLIAWTVRFLLEGDLTAEERAAGITTEFPLEGLELLNVGLESGVLTLTFADPEHRTSGGACRAGILWAQIEATAKQFPSVEQVKFSPEDLFQP